MSKDIERISHFGQELAVIIPAGFREDGIEFFTSPEYSQQLAYMNRPLGHQIDAHVHNKVDRQVQMTLEVLLIRSGRVRMDLYTSEREYVTSRELTGGDIVLLVHGGHGFEMLEPSEIVEIKQGPYVGDEDKTRFDPESRS